MDTETLAIEPVKEKRRKARVINWSEVADWDSPYDLVKPPPVYSLPEWTVGKIMLNMTLSEPTVRGSAPLLKLIKDAKKEKTLGEGGGNKKLKTTKT